MWQTKYAICRFSITEFRDLFFWRWSYSDIHFLLSTFMHTHPCFKVISERDLFLIAKLHYVSINFYPSAVLDFLHVCCKNILEKDRYWIAKSCNSLFWRWSFALIWFLQTLINSTHASARDSFYQDNSY